MTQAISGGRISFARRDISILARKISAETGLPHAKAIDMIATAMGYAGGNALMGALKTSEAEAPKPIPVAPEGAERGYLHEVRFRFLSDENFEDGVISLHDILYEVDEGGAVGQMGPEIKSIPLTKETMSELAIEFGSTPDFFFGHEQDD